MRNRQSIVTSISPIHWFGCTSFSRNRWTAVSEAARISYPEAVLQSLVASTRATIWDMLSVNPVVRGKVEQECYGSSHWSQRVCRRGPGRRLRFEELKAERAVLKHKTMALSDLLAVFRAA